MEQQSGFYLIIKSIGIDEKNKVLQTNYTIYQQLHNYSDGAVRDLFNIETKINVKEL